MEKQKYIKPETSIVEMESCTILAGSPGVENDGKSADLYGEFETGGDAGSARVRKRDLWDE